MLVCSDTEAVGALEVVFKFSVNLFIKFGGLNVVLGFISVV